MKTKEELNALKEELDTLNRKFAELTEDELAQVTGGVAHSLYSYNKRALEMDGFVSYILAGHRLGDVPSVE